MKEQCNDRRVDRTRSAITSAFMQLMIEKEFEDITVTELAKRADINRKTFYSHYDCIEDVLDELQLDIAERILDIYKKHNYGPFDIAAFTDTLNEILSENYQLYRKLIVANSYRFFSRNIKDTLKNTFLMKYAQRDTGKVGKEIINLAAEYCVSGLAKMYKVWFEKPCGITKEQLADLAGKMLWGGLKTVLG